jgi:hypothetical protein
MYIQNDEAQYGTGLILNECNYNVFLHKYVVCIKATQCYRAFVKEKMS